MPIAVAIEKNTVYVKETKEKNATILFHNDSRMQSHPMRGGHGQERGIELLRR